MLLGSENRNTLGAARSLGHLGIPLIVGGAGRFASSNHSRFVCRHFTYPPVEEGMEAAGGAVRAAIEHWQPAVLLPSMDDSWALVYEYWDNFSELTSLVPAPGREIFERFTNKAFMTQHAVKNQVPVPATYFPKERSDALALSGELRYPVLIKPAGSTGGRGIRMAANPEDLESILEESKGTVMVQEYVEGEDLELTLLFFHGEPLAGSAYVSLRNHPLPYGPPIACRTIRDDQLMEFGIRMLKSLDYHGVAHLDFRRDRRDGVPKLLDFNVRLAGTNEISARSGVDFALMLYKLALGEKLEPCFEYRIGLEFRWVLFGEIQHLLKTPQKSKTIRELLRWRGVKTNVDLRDPLPHLAHLLSWLNQQ
jgi:predicted ATP-grasp superfamily ATP-dependent carboligase